MKGIQIRKRFLADCVIESKPNLSNRKLAQIAGVSHTYIANRRKITQKEQNKEISEQTKLFFKLSDSFKHIEKQHKKYAY
jgi:hypothetical protein